MVPENDNTSELERAEDSQRLFELYIEALRILAMDSEAQCEAIGWYNVAWELRSEVCAARYFVTNPMYHFSVKQVAGIKRICAAFDNLPSDVLREAKTREENLVAMQHECWNPLRALALETLSLLGDGKDFIVGQT